MSENEPSGQESSDIHECPVDDCGYSGTSNQGVLTHFGQVHDDDVKRQVFIDELHRLSDEFDRTPVGSDVRECGRFSRTLYKRSFGSWNEALEAAGFDPNVQTNISKEDLLDELHRLADEVSGSLVQSDMEKQGAYSISTYERYFGSWTSALEEAGLELNGSWGVSDEVLLESLRQLADELGHIPKQSDMREFGTFSIGACQYRFGGWNDAIEEAGLMPDRQMNICQQRLLAELQRLADDLGRTPIGEDMMKYGRFSLTPYINTFGTWNAALEAAGFTPDYVANISDDDLLYEIQRLADKYERAPFRDEMREYGCFSAEVYHRHFGGWNSALEAAGFEPNLPWEWSPSGENHPHWNGGTSRYGPGWTEAKREQVRDRDNRECQSCGRSEEDHIKMSGKKHSVHHIQKARSFDDPEKRNHPDNLVTLCETKYCHKKWDMMSPLRPQIHNRSVQGGE